MKEQISIEKLDPTPIPTSERELYSAALARFSQLEAAYAAVCAPESLSHSIQSLSTVCEGSVDLASIRALLMTLRGNPCKRDALHSPPSERFKLVLSTAMDRAVMLAASVTDASEQVATEKAPHDGGNDGEATEKEDSVSVHDRLQVSIANFPLAVHEECLRLAYQNEDDESLQKLVAAAKARCHRGCESADGHPTHFLELLLHLIEALQLLESARENASVSDVNALAMALDELVKHPRKHTVANMLVAAGKLMCARLDILIDKSASLTTEDRDKLLFSLRVATVLLQQIRTGDVLSQSALAVRYGDFCLSFVCSRGSMKEDARQNIRTLNEAAAILSRAIEIVTVYRQRLLGTSSSKSPPADAGGDATTTASSSPPVSNEVNRTLSCVHVDLIMLLTRLQLQCGVFEQQERRTQMKLQQQREMDQREKSSTIYGKVTVSERKRHLQNLRKADALQLHPSHMEHSLLDSCGSNSYKRALILMQAAPFHEDVQRRGEMLNEAMRSLAAARQYEENFRRKMTDASTSTLSEGSGAALLTSKLTHVPAPLISQCTTTEIVVSPPPINVRGRHTATRWAVYAKSYGSGVAVSVNNTDFDGSGIKRSLDDSITIRGLTPNSTYMVAYAMYDNAGCLIGSISCSTEKVHTVLQLPLLLCWSYLTEAAYHCGCVGILRTAGKFVLDEVAPSAEGLGGAGIVRGAASASDGTNASSVSAESDSSGTRSSATVVYLHNVVGQTSIPHVRAMIRSLILYSMVGGGASAGSGKSKARTSMDLNGQLSVLKTGHVLLLAMEMAAIIGDIGLVEETALRTHSVLLPLSKRRECNVTILTSLMCVLTFLETIRERRSKELTDACAFMAYKADLFFLDQSELLASTNVRRLQLPILKNYSFDNLPDSLRSLQEFVLRSSEWRKLDSTELNQRVDASGGDFAGQLLCMLNPQTGSGVSLSDDMINKLKAAAEAGELRCLEVFFRLCEDAKKRLGEEQRLFDIVDTLFKSVSSMTVVTPQVLAQIPPPEGLTSGIDGTDEDENGDGALASLQKEHATSILGDRLPSLLRRRKAILRARLVRDTNIIWKARIHDFMATSRSENLLERLRKHVGEMTTSQASETDASAANESDAWIRDEFVLIAGGFVRAAELSGRCRRWEDLSIAFIKLMNHSDLFETEMENLSLALGSQYKVVCYRVLDMLRSCRGTTEEVDTKKDVPSAARDEGESASEVRDSWLTKVDFIDADKILLFVKRAMTIMERLEKYETVIEIGERFNKLTDDQFAESILEKTLRARKALHHSVEADERALSLILRDKSLAVEILHRCRHYCWEGSRRTPLDIVKATNMYKDAIERLSIRGENFLMSIAQAELGDVLYRQGDVQAANLSWNDSLDTIFSTYGVLGKWREAIKGGPSLYKSLGDAGCFHGVVVLYKLSNFSGENASSFLKTECSLMASKIVLAVFSSSLTHPTQPVNFCDYTPTEMWEGRDIFGDPFECNATELKLALEHLVSTLMDCDMFVEVQPMLSLLEHIIATKFRDVSAIVRCRLRRLKSLYSCGRIRKAHKLMWDVIYGKGLPSPLSGDVIFKDSATGKVIDMGFPADDEEGAEETSSFRSLFKTNAIDSLRDMTVPEVIAAYYGDVIMGEIVLAKAEMLAVYLRVSNLHILDDDFEVDDAFKKSLCESIIMVANNVIEKAKTKAVSVMTACQAHLLIASVADSLLNVGDVLRNSELAMRALREMDHDDGSGGGGCTQGSPAVIWMKCRAAMAKALYEIGDKQGCVAVCEAAIRDAETHDERLFVLKLMHTVVMIDIEGGDISAALSGFKNIKDRYASLRMPTCAHRAAVLADFGTLMSRLGQHSTAVKLSEEASSIVMNLLSDHGITSLKTRSELLMFYPHSHLTAAVLFRAGRARLRLEDTTHVEKAVTRLSQAKDMLMASPTHLRQHGLVVCALSSAERAAASTRLLSVIDSGGSGADEDTAASPEHRQAHGAVMLRCLTRFDGHRGRDMHTMRTCALKMVEATIAASDPSTSSSSSSAAVSACGAEKSARLLQACAEISRADNTVFRSNTTFKLSEKAEIPAWLLVEVCGYEKNNFEMSDVTLGQPNHVGPVSASQQSILLCMYRKLELLLRQINFSVTIEVNMMERARQIFTFMEHHSADFKTQGGLGKAIEILREVHKDEDAAAEGGGGGGGATARVDSTMEPGLVSWQWYVEDKMLSGKRDDIGVEIEDRGAGTASMDIVSNLQLEHAISASSDVRTRLRQCLPRQVAKLVYVIAAPKGEGDSAAVDSVTGVFDVSVHDVLAVSREICSNPDRAQDAIAAMLVSMTGAPPPKASAPEEEGTASGDADASGSKRVLSDTAALDLLPLLVDLNDGLVATNVELAQWLCTHLGL